MSQRMTIRSAFESSLSVMAGFTILPASTEDVPPGQLPAIRIYFDRETATAQLHGSSDRQMDMLVSVVLKDKTDIYQALDSAADSVEAALGDPRLGGACLVCLLTQTQFLLDDSQPLGEVRLTYSVTY